jgi:AraC-like DNA-binding protein
MHTHACTEIVWYRDCSGWLPQGEERLRYEPGSLAIYQPWLNHGDECEKGGSQLCVGISGGGADRLPVGMWQVDETTRNVLVQMCDGLDAHDHWRQKRLNLLSGWLTLELGRQFDNKLASESREPFHVEAARRILDTRYAESLSMTGIAAELSINADYLRQLFVEWVGEPPLRHLIRKRLEAACDLLRLNQESTAAIAKRVGIPNPHYFNRLFRQRLGTTPGQYRARYTGSSQKRTP